MAEEVLLSPWGAETKLSNDRRVLRVVRITEHFFFPPDLERPKVAVFTPTEDDVDQGKARGKQPLVSVWDAGLGLDDIKRNRNLDSTEIAQVLALQVGVVHENIRVEDTGMVPVEVHNDPIEDSKGSTGGKWHAGIQGLYRPPGKPKLLYKKLIEDILELCEKVN